jgi:hypothetical protein
VVPACLCPSNLRTNASSESPIAIARSAASTCLRPPVQSYSCSVAIVSIRLVTTSI